MKDSVERVGDMHSRKSLMIVVQEGGDVVVAIMGDRGLMEERGTTPPEDRTAQVEFCTIPGGGKSQHTRKALQQLAEAIKRDNEESPQSIPGYDTTIPDFAELLEQVGFDGALELIQDELVPLAQQEHISLWEAAWRYSDQDEEQDTSWFQLFHAMQKAPENVAREKGILRAVR